MESLPLIFRRFDGGWVTELSSDELEVSMSPDMVNADFVKGGAIKKTPGYQAFGSDADSTDTAYDLIVAPNRNGVEWLFKSAGTKLKIYDEANNSFYTIKTGLTAGSRFGYIVFNNTLHLGNPDDNPMTIDLGKITKLDGAITAGATSIDVEDASQLASSGTVKIKGSDVTYSGKSTNTLTGCSGAPAADSGSVVTVAPTELTSGTPPPKGNMYILFSGRLIIAGVTGSGGATVYGSKATDRTNFAIAGGSTADDAFAFALPAKVNSIQAFLDDNQEERIMAFCDNNKTYAINVTDDATNGTLTTREVFREGVSALNFFTTRAADNDIYHIDLNNQVRTLGSKYANQGVAKNFSDSISNATHGTLFKEDYDFSNARALVTNERYYLVSRHGTAGNVNNQIVIYDKTKRAWLKRENVNLNDIVVYNKKVLATSALGDNKVYQFDESYRDDNGASLYFRYATPDIDIEPLRFDKVRRVRLSGLMSTSCVLKIYVFRDFGSVEIANFTLNGSDSNIIGSILGEKGTFGSIAFGGQAFGGEGGEDVRFFIADLDLQHLPDVENFRIVAVNDQKGVYLEISKIKPFVYQQNEHYFPSEYILNSN